MPSGYYRYPTLNNDTIIFVCEDDLWTLPAAGGLARRLTSNLGEITSPFFSPSGSQVAFVGRDDGQPEVYVMPARGGRPRRLTFQGSSQVLVAGWTPDGKIVFASHAGQPFRHLLHLYTLDPQGGEPVRLNVGPARAVAFGRDGAVVIGRNTSDPARWKRYRGGTAGQLWIDPDGKGDFHPLLQLKGNLASPIWLGARVYFLSDHEGFGNLYSCLPDGSDLQRHTDHADFYARSASSDGRRIIYHAGADLYLFDPVSGQSSKIEVEFYSPQVQRGRRFVDPERYLSGWAIHPHGIALAVQIRGFVTSLFNWEGPVIHHGDPEIPARYRLPAWLNDNRRMVAVTDSQGEEVFVILSADGSQSPQPLPQLDIGRPEAIAVNPKHNQIVFSNHRYEICFLDLDTHELKKIEKGKNAPIAGFDWSPDGEWVAYSVSISNQLMAIKVWKAATGEIFQVTRPVLRDVSPAFDPQGRYLYFLSYRTYDPVADNMGFDLSFPKGEKPYLIPLQKDTPSPFVRQPHFLMEEKKVEPAPNPAEKPKGTPESGEALAAEEDQKKTESAETRPDEPEKPKAEDIKVKIDLDGIERRIIEFPTREGRYGRVQGSTEKKVFYSVFQVEGTLNDSFIEEEPPGNGTLYWYDLEEQKEEVFLNRISDFQVSRDGKTLAVRAGNRLRVFKAAAKPNGEGGEGPGRKTGWIDLHRVRVSVHPGVEWTQMFHEVWRLQRDQFWTPDMSKIDWLSVHDRYLPLVDRVASRSEFSDLVWELQGELSTSHCYEFGGDYRPGPHYIQGQLGADFSYAETAGGWKLIHIVRGDSWDDRNGSPLEKAGLDIAEGDVLMAINGIRLGRERSPNAALINLANTEVTLTFAPRASAMHPDEGSPLHPDEGSPSHPDDDSPSNPGKDSASQPDEGNASHPGEGSASHPDEGITVKTIGNETSLRYREWVERNRAIVHEATGGKVGYLHIPDMSSRGYAEFHRGFLGELDYPGLIVDLRFNGGGNVSALLLEKLARKRLGYDVTRWNDLPNPYPAESVMGPMVALTNEHAGSDGDMFSHAFKLMGLGPLIGKRTWGGVVGIWPRHVLADGTVTTQPEFSTWFKDVGWGLENYGADPDIEVEITPQEYARGVDTQLERSIQEILSLLAANPPTLPDFSSRPNLAPPALPAR